MARFDIISGSDAGVIRHSGKPRYSGSYLKPSYLEFTEISSPVPIAWEVGDYVDYPRTGMRYRLYSIPQASKNARKDSHGKAFTYSNVQFHAATKELEIALFRDIVSNDNNIHFSTSPDVVTYEDVYGIVSRIQACMDDLYPGRWDIRVADFSDAEVSDKVSTKKDFALSGGTCLDALSKIYELWQDIGWIHTHEDGMEVITVGYANELRSDNISDEYLYGKGNGLTAIRKNQTNKEEFATRLYVYGSDRNLPPRYYTGFHNAESADIRNLMLPMDVWGMTDGSPDPRLAYLENAEAVAKYGVIPKTHYFDSDDAGADIYPTIEGLTAGEVRALAGGLDSYYPDESIYPDSERMDEVLEASVPADDGVQNRDGEEYEEIQTMDISSFSTTIAVPEKSTVNVYRSGLLFSTEFDKEGMAEISTSPSMNIILTGTGIASASITFELADSQSQKTRTTAHVVKSEAVQVSDTAWSVPLPEMKASYTRTEYGSFPVYLTASINIVPESGDARDITVVSPSAELYVRFKRVLSATFAMKLKQIGFDISKRAAQGSGKTISMKSGMCEGRSFVISSCTYDSDGDSWNLVCKRQKDDTLNVLFPNVDYPVIGGDEFVLVDIAMPDLYVEVAMNRLLARGEELLARASKEIYHYEPSIDAKVMAESGRTLREGMYMAISDEDVIGDAKEHILIDTLSIYEDESAIPTYKVTLRERRKVTYKGTPSATSSSGSSSVEEQSADAGIVNERLLALETLLDMFYWHDAAKTVIGTKYDFFSQRTVASGGVGKSGSEGGGGSGVVVLESWDAYDATLPQVLGALLGLELHNRLTAVENGLIDIDSQYATIAYVEQKISDLIGGADSAYDTLIEIQNILQGNEANITTLLEAIATKASTEDLTALDEKYAALIEALQAKDTETGESITALEAKDAEHDAAITELQTKDTEHDTAITALQAKDTEIDAAIQDHEERIAAIEDKEEMFEWVTDADGTRRIKTTFDFYSEKTVASGGKGEKGEGGGGTGTVMAVEVNGTIHDAVDGIVTLPDYPTKDAYDSKMSALDAKDVAFTADIAENAQAIASLEPRVEKNEGDISDLQNVDKDIKEQIADIRKITDRFSYDSEQDMLLTPSNLASQKTIASGGVGTEGSGEQGASGTLDSLYDVEIDFTSEAPTEEDRPMLAYDTTDFIWKNRKTMHRHPQGVASSVWTITHNLNKVPNVKVIDSTGEQVFGTVKIGDSNGKDTMNTIRIIFGGAFSGVAYLD